MLGSSSQRIGVVRSYPRKSQIIREDDPADHVYEVVSGTDDGEEFGCSLRWISAKHLVMARFSGPFPWEYPICNFFENFS